MNIIVVSSEGRDDKDIDADSLDQWLRECEEYKEAGVYSEIAQHVHRTRDGIHLDLCSGTFELLAELQKQGVPGHLIGIEVNNNHIEEAQKNLSGQNVVNHIFRVRDGQTMFLDSDSPTRSNLYRRDWDSLKDQVLIVEGNMLTIENQLDAVLASKKATSSSISFLGSSPKIVLRDNPVTYKDFRESVRKVVVATFARATQFTEEEGTLTYVERSNVPRNYSPQQMVEAATHIYIRDYEALLAPHWIRSAPVELLHTFPEAENVDMYQRAQQAMDSGMVRKAFVVSFERTSVPLTKKDEDRMQSVVL